MAVERYELMSDYQEFVAAEYGVDPAREDWAITDDAVADWAIRKIAQAERNIEKRREFVEAEIDRLRRWQEQANTEDQRSIEFFTSHLHAYFEQLRESGALGKRKSYRLPHGTLQVRAKPPTFTRDNDQLLEWAQGTGDESLVRVKIEPAWSDIRKRITIAPDGRTVIDTETGEIVPGVTVTELGSETFSVTTEVDN